MASVGRALSSYERTLVSGASRFDRWHFAGDETAVSDEVKRGWIVNHPAEIVGYLLFDPASVADRLPATVRFITVAPTPSIICVRRTSSTGRNS